MGGSDSSPTTLGKELQTNSTKSETTTLSPTTFAVLGSVGCITGSYIIANVIYQRKENNNNNNDSISENKFRRNKFVLGCTLVGVGLNYFSYYVFPEKEVNYYVKIDPIRRSGLWALYGCTVGLITGHFLFIV